MKQATTALLLSLSVAGPAFAATPEAYAELDRASAAACVRASGLVGARAGPVTRFSDRFLMDARTVTGTWPQARMKGAQATMLCLFNRRTRQAETQELASGPPTPGSSADAIRGITWRATDINGRAPVGPQPITLVLGADGTVSGASGCNRFSGSYSLSGPRLQIRGPLVSTKMACAPAINGQEATFQQILGRAAQVERRGSELILTATDRRTLRFVRK